ncbi:putative ankyrin repeat protein [Smittium culicis]|uniref:Putative ankyrin repeat protein n=1 Tax=Smittium culicis TaxID=133412 RepID=A0A1R1XUH6_9FUNG|nr:putative ankyrin repeat protein [Smittium culicis]
MALILKIEKFSLSELNKFLLKACSSGRLEIVKEIVKAGAEIDHNKNLPIAKACKSGSFELVSWLHSNGADLIDPKSKCFYYSCSSHNFGLVVLMTSYGYKLTKGHNEYYKNCVSVFTKLDKH